MTGKSATDEDLLQAAISGDSESFSIIVRRWEKKIYSLCYGILTNHSIIILETVENVREDFCFNNYFC